jgi:hypothetical protein
MAEYPYCANVASLRRFLEILQNDAVPRRIGPQYMRGLGFQGSDARSVVSTLKALGFLNAAGVPTERWRLYRDKSIATHVLAQALHETYAEVFEAYPDVYRKDSKVLVSFFGSQTGVAKSTLTYMVRTFRALCGLANLEPEDGQAPHSGIKTQSAAESDWLQRDIVESRLHGAAEGDGAVAAVLRAREGLVGHPVTLSITVQLQLPVSEDPKVYEALFAALRRELLL